MLYHDLLDCDRKLTVCGTNVLLAERIIPAWDNGALSSNTLRKTVVSDELKPMKSRHRDWEITPTVYMELRREETEF